MEICSIYWIVSETTKICTSIDNVDKLYIMYTVSTVAAGEVQVVCHYKSFTDLHLNGICLKRKKNLNTFHTLYGYIQDRI